jgi:hypothetical protein
MTPATESVFHGVPSFFRYGCQDAREGGSHSYRDAGYHLGLHTIRLTPDGYTVAEWIDYLCETINEPMERGDVEVVWRWLMATFPRCLALVPRRHKISFVEAVIRGYNSLVE